MSKIFINLAEEIYKNKSLSLCTVVATTGSTPRKAGAKMLVFPDKTINGTIGGGSIEKEVIDKAVELLSINKPQLLHFELKQDLDMYCGGTMDVFIEPIRTAGNLYIFGAGHVGRMVAKYALDMGFKVTLIDERKGIFNEFETAATCINQHPIQALQQLAFDDNTYSVIVTHQHIHDAEILKNICKKPHAYIGVISSKIKAATMKQQFIQENILTADEFDKINMPIGIKLACETPAEIAVSIVAQLIEIKNTINKVG